jgi:amidase
MYELMTATNPSIMNLIFSSSYLKESYGPQIEAKGHRKAFELRAAYDKALENVDVLITPTAPTIAMPHPRTSASDGVRIDIMARAQVAVGVVANTCAFNVTGHPALSVPCGFGSVQVEGVEKKLPVGMQIIAKRFDEETLLQAAAVFEAGRNMSFGIH